LLFYQAYAIVLCKDNEKQKKAYTTMSERSPFAPPTSELSSQPTAPDQIVVPAFDGQEAGAEVGLVEAPDYSELKQDILDRSKVLNPMQNLTELRNFLDDVYDDAAQGRLVGSKENVYDPAALTDQFASLLKELNAQDAEPLMRVPSAGGLRSAARAFLAEASTAGPFVQALQEKILSVENEARSREEPARQLGEKALDLTQVEVVKRAEPVDVLEELTKGLSEGDTSNLRRYAQASEDVRLAQKEGRGEDSTYHQQTKGQAYRDMSPSAQAVAIRFDGHYNMPA
jgi:hypothetical protein